MPDENEDAITEDFNAAYEAITKNFSPPSLFKV